MTYRPIQEYGIIGDMHSAALVGTNGSIDWLCFPHFDSPSAFAAILDRRRTQNGDHRTRARRRHLHQRGLYPDQDASTADRLVPYTVFIDPQLGLSEVEAREQGYDVRVAKMSMNYVARAIEMDESRGMMKAVAALAESLNSLFAGVDS
jgi:hypothetical protein